MTLLGRRNLQGKPLFTSSRRAPSFQTRGVEIAEEIGGATTRPVFLTPGIVQAVQALVWVGHANVSTVRRLQGLAPQILDVLDPPLEPAHRADFIERCRAFRFLILNTKSTREHIGPVPEHGWKSWVVPHHHSNSEGYTLPEDRLENPRVIGFIGAPEELHDAKAIEHHARKMGLTFLTVGPNDTSAFHLIDIGICWTRPNSLRDDTASSQSLVNFAARGIPSVVPNYESHRDVDEALGGGACLVAREFADWLDRLEDLIHKEDLRRAMAAKAPAAQIRYSRSSIGALYKGLLFDAKTEAPPD